MQRSLIPSNVDGIIPSIRFSGWLRHKSHHQPGLPSMISSHQLPNPYFHPTKLNVFIPALSPITRFKTVLISIHSLICPPPHTHQITNLQTHQTILKPVKQSIYQTPISEPTKQPSKPSKPTLCRQPSAPSAAPRSTTSTPQSILQPSISSTERRNA